jgi:hypothetical protein
MIADIHGQSLTVLGYQRFCPQLLSSDDNTGDKLLTSPSTA